jgi:hypothetical protein
MSTLSLQLVFSPTDPVCLTYGRFSTDVSGGSLNQRSKVWIQDGTVLGDITPSVTILSSDPGTPMIQICVVANLPLGWSWATGLDGYCLRITAVFGRAHHGTQREQAYASPFSIHNQDSTSIATVFDQHYSNVSGNPKNYPVIPNNNQGVLTIGFARFRSAAPPQLTAISPTTYYSQDPNTYTITGVNLLGATPQWGGGVTATVTTNTATVISGMLHAPDVSAPQSGSVAVTLDGETSNSLTFSIQPSPDLAEETAPRAAAGGPSGNANSRTVGTDLYEFNVGATAYVSNAGGPAKELTFGHDPDMDVGS